MATTKKAVSKSKRTTKSTAAASNGSDMAMIGRYTFLAGVVVSIIAGILFVLPGVNIQSVQMPIAYIIIVLALVGGWLHIGKDSQKGFLIIALALSFFADRLNFVPVVGPYITSALGLLGLFVSIAALAIVARTVIGWFRS
ncbi:MAG: hypothetical protein KF821_02235 [Anaerolineales bacterium]|nr:hypothetical protein [Anaerolineales bacterium]MCW5838498.1 hypothetical protein [Anaerolineales bacterium]